MPKKDKPGYQTVGQKAESGEYDLIYPLDMLILDLLPNEGTTMGGYYDLGTSVQAIGEALKGAKLGPDYLSGRLRSMMYQGLVLRIKAVGSSTSKWQWQRTPTGKKLLDEWKEKERGTPKGGGQEDK